jgi:hypothetical protein
MAAHQNTRAAAVRVTGRGSEAVQNCPVHDLLHRAAVQQTILVSPRGSGLFNGSLSEGPFTVPVIDR